MHLPVNINDLLNSAVVESDRLEFKADWNPEAVLRTICAFANDFNNFGGGYIVIGVEEVDGNPVFPPKGISKTQADKIQKEIVRICSYLKPIYTPIVAFEEYREKYILIIWVPGGLDRPYSAPATLGKEKEYKYFIRKLSTTVISNNDEIKELINLTATVPFDDRINHHAALLDIKLPLIQSFLKEVDSKLLKESADIPFSDLCRQMAIVNGGNEYLKPRNVGLLFFHDEPEKFFPYIQIDVVYFPDDEGGDIIEEAIFKGPLDRQLRDALRHIKNNFIIERVLKIPGEAKAKRFFNYPYEAIEEALVNAVYHRSYDIREPIEVRINRTTISVVSHPGPDSSITLEDMQSRRMVSRRYRNRRIGEFLKELEFTEGRGTGVPKMRWALQKNGSSEPVFFTDGARQSFWTEIKIHPEFLIEHIPLEAQVEAYVEARVEAYVRLTEIERKILNFCLKNPIGNKGIVELLGYRTLSGNVKKALQRLREMGAIVYTVPDKPRSQNQQYKVTEKGKGILRESS